MDLKREHRNTNTLIGLWVWMETCGWICFSNLLWISSLCQQEGAPISMSQHTGSQVTSKARVRCVGFHTVWTQHSQTCAFLGNVTTLISALTLTWPYALLFIIYHFPPSRMEICLGICVGQGICLIPKSLDSQHHLSILVHHQYDSIKIACFRGKKYFISQFSTEEVKMTLFESCNFLQMAVSN